MVTKNRPPHQQPHRINTAKLQTQRVKNSISTSYRSWKKAEPAARNILASTVIGLSGATLAVFGVAGHNSISALKAACDDPTYVQTNTDVLDSERAAFCEIINGKNTTHTQRMVVGGGIALGAAAVGANRHNRIRKRSISR